MTKVKAVQDDSGHWYLIPNGLIDDFDSDLEDEDFDFGAKYGEYMTGGDLNNIQLYIEEWIPVTERLPKSEKYYKVRFKNGEEDEKPFRIRPNKNIFGFMTEEEVTHWAEID